MNQTTLPSWTDIVKTQSYQASSVEDKEFAVQKYYSELSKQSFFDKNLQTKIMQKLRVEGGIGEAFAPPTTNVPTYSATPSKFLEAVLPTKETIESAGKGLEERLAAPPVVKSPVEQLTDIVGQAEGVVGAGLNLISGVGSTLGLAGLGVVGIAETAVREPQWSAETINWYKGWWEKYLTFKPKTVKGKEVMDTIKQQMMIQGRGSSFAIKLSENAKKGLS